MKAPSFGEVQYVWQCIRYQVANPGTDVLPKGLRHLRQERRLGQKPWTFRDYLELRRKRRQNQRAFDEQYRRSE